MTAIIIPGVPYFKGESPEKPTQVADRFVNDLNIIQYTIPEEIYKAAVAAYSDLQVNDKHGAEFDTDAFVHDDMKTSYVDISLNGTVDIVGDVGGHSVQISIEKGMDFIQHALASATVEYKTLEMILVYKDTRDLAETQELIEGDNYDLNEHIKMENVYWKTDTNLIIPKPPVEIKYFLSINGVVGGITKEGVAINDDGLDSEINFD